MELDLQHQSQCWLGLQERELHVWFRRLSIGVRSAVDVGAHDGMYTLYFLARTPATRVVAIEPDTGCIDIFRRNIALNGLEEDRRLDLLTKFAGDVTESEHVALDSLIPILEQPCLVKVDIDGGEVALLRGARELLGRRDTRWIIEVHSEELEAECAKILADAEYRTTTVPKAWWRSFIPELRPLEFNRWVVAVRVVGGLQKL